jgi:hypothetical protein
VDDFAELSAVQHGVFTRRQAFEHGITPSRLAAQLRAGRWRRLHNHVYATFTGEPSRAAQLWAAVLRAGRGAVLSHQTAAELQGLGDAGTMPISVTVPADRRVARFDGVRVQVSARVRDARHPTRSPPQTRVEETVVDLTQVAGTLDDALGWLARACGRRLTTPDRLAEAMARRPRLRWRAELASALVDVAEGCHSLLELRYLRDVERRHGLPTASRQVSRRRRGGRWYDDVNYAAYATRVELDGGAGHGDRAGSRDRRRDNAAVVGGDAVLRYGWDDVAGRACATAAEVAAVLRRNGCRRPARACGTACVIKEVSGRHGDRKPSRSSGDDSHHGGRLRSSGLG